MIKNNNKRMSNNKRNLIRAILVVLFILLIAFLTIQTYNRGKSETPTETPIYLDDNGGSKEGEAVARTREEILDELKKQQLIVTDKLSSNITFASSNAGEIGEWIIENPEENSIIVQGEVYLNDVLIAKSTPIYPNVYGNVKV